MYHREFMVMCRQKSVQAIQQDSLIIFTKMQAATAFRCSVVAVVMALLLVVIGFWIVLLLVRIGALAVRPVLMPSEGVWGTLPPLQ